LPNAPIIIYDLQFRKRAYLQNAFNIGFEKTMNGLWQAQFSLPVVDKKNEECQPLCYVELFDGNERIDLFRITPAKAERSRDGRTITYTCEHVLGTLIDNVMFLNHTVGDIGTFTRASIQYILDHQSVPLWQLGEVAFDRQFKYTWENENLLSALWSIARPFDEEYHWQWDTTVKPWKLHLRRPTDKVQAYIRYGVNMTGITKTVDPTNMCNRIYGLGYGEGDNQLTFASINNGLPYLENVESQAKYGIIEYVMSDMRFKYEDTLMAHCQAVLDESCKPRVSYQTTAADIHRLTGQRIHKYADGALIRVQDEEMGEDFVARLVKVGKSDVTGNPGEVTLEISDKVEDFSNTIAKIINDQRIASVYDNGATNYDSHDFADNCDPAHPAVLQFWLPDETVRVNKVRLSFQVEAFRAFERGLASAPAVSSGPSSASTTKSQPATSSGASSNTTTSSGGGVTGTKTGIYVVEPGKAPEPTADAGSHNHGIANGTQLALAGGGAVTWAAVDNHSHGVFNHGHHINLPAHQHDMPHTHQIPEHSHEMPHTHQIPGHTHEIEYGIYEGPTPTAVTIRVDGNVVPDVEVNMEELDIVEFLAKDSDGKVRRGRHQIEIAPNNLGRIVASVFTQIFVQSRGGGDY